MPDSFITKNLSLQTLSANDYDFVFELLNTKGWIEFIGNRNINSKEDAVNYINKILAAQNIIYWVVRLKNENIPIGIVSFIKRDYLPHHDLGFAFLTEFTGFGYAYEAAKEVMITVMSNPQHSHLLATTIPQNINSIRLLTKLGFIFEKQMEIENEMLHLYLATADLVLHQQ